MSKTALARWEFATTTSIHFLFVLLTLGLVVQVAIAQTRWVRTGDPVWERMARFWGQLYVINYAVGIATGLVMEFQFGLNWSGLSRMTGAVFGAPLALETIIAFFLESTFLGMWIFGWGRLNKRVHLAVLWGVVTTAVLSAFWVIVANAFLQHPVGYALGVDGTARLTSMGALLGNGNLWLALLHVLAAAAMTGGFFVAGVSAWHFLRGTGEVELFRRSLRRGLSIAGAGSFFTIAFGYAQFPILDATQPAKFAVALGGPAKLRQAQLDMAAAHGPGNWLPPGSVHAAFQIMRNLGNLFFLLAVIAAVILLRRNGLRQRWLLRVMVWAIPLPFIAALAGWFVREEGRQPWAVYGVLRTTEAVSGVSTGGMLTTFIGFGLLLLGLAVTDWYLLARFARRGPGDEFVAEPATAPAPALSMLGG